VLPPSLVPLRDLLQPSSFDSKPASLPKRGLITRGYNRYTDGIQDPDVSLVIRIEWDALKFSVDLRPGSGAALVIT